MVLTVSLELPPSLDIKTSRTEPFNGKDGKKRTQFYSYQASKDQFAQIERLFSLRYCLYEQAGSFLGSFIQSRPSQDTLGKYFFNGTLRKWQKD